MLEETRPDHAISRTVTSTKLLYTASTSKKKNNNKKENFSFLKIVIFF